MSFLRFDDDDDDKRDDSEVRVIEFVDELEGTRFAPLDASSS